MIRRLCLPFWVFFCAFASLGMAQNSASLVIPFQEFQEEALSEKDEIWVVDFWASWCGPCIASMPHLKKVIAQYTDRPVRFVSVSWDDDPARWQWAMDRLDMTWPQTIVPQDAEGQFFLEDNFPHQGIPCLFLITHKGKVRRFGHDPYGLEMAIDRLLRKMEKDLG